MARLIDFETYVDKRGSLSVIDKVVPFQIKRVFYIYNVDGSKRGYHKHKKTIQLAFCITGSCDIYIKKNDKLEKFSMNKSNFGLLLEPNDFHWMENFSKDAILVVLASENFNPDDYIYDDK